MESRELAENLMVEYLYLTEKYDKSVPHTINNMGDAIPHKEYIIQSTKYAGAKRSEMEHIASDNEVSSLDFRDANKYVNGFNFFDIERIYLSLEDFHLGV